MQPIELTDGTDPRLDPYRDLPARGDDPAATFVAESAIAVERLLASPLETLSVACTPARVSRFASINCDAPLYVVPGAVLDQVVGFKFHRGCAAIGRRPSMPTEQMLVALAPHPTILVAERLADPSNLGALARNAAAFGVGALIVDKQGADPFSRRSIRASMGHVFTRLVIQCEQILHLTRQLSQRGEMRVLAAVTAPNATDVGKLDPGKNWTLLVGNEGAGLSTELASVAHERVTIPMDPTADSLNVAAATAVLLYALRTV
jgi:tRNA G18 (ribose-2'-O)-methylase SpoU